MELVFYLIVYLFSYQIKLAGKRMPVNFKIYKLNNSYIEQNHVSTVNFTFCTNVKEEFFLHSISVNLIS